MQRAPHPDYLDLLARYSKAVQKLALGAREMILEEAPEASEFIYELYTITDHFTFTERSSDAFVFTTAHAKWVNLGFHLGAALPDPHGLLRGEGKSIRHARIAKAADLEAPGVRELVRASMAWADRSEGEAGKPGVVVRRTQSAGRRPGSGARRH